MCFCHTQSPGFILRVCGFVLAETSHIHKLEQKHPPRSNAGSMVMVKCTLWGVLALGRRGGAGERIQGVAGFRRRGGEGGGGVEFHSMQMKEETLSFPDAALGLEGKHGGQGAEGHLVAVGREGAHEHRLTVPCDGTSEDSFNRNGGKMMEQRDRQ